MRGLFQAPAAAGRKAFHDAGSATGRSGAPATAAGKAGTVVQEELAVAAGIAVHAASPDARADDSSAGETPVALAVPAAEAVLSEAGNWGGPHVSGLFRFGEKVT